MGWGLGEGYGMAEWNRKETVQQKDRNEQKRIQQKDDDRKAKEAWEGRNRSVGMDLCCDDLAINYTAAVYYLLTYNI
jgi:hypothetical protein